MGPSDVLQVRRAAALHDIGKMAIPDSILDKPGPLDDGEWRLMASNPDDSSIPVTEAARRCFK